MRFLKLDNIDTFIRSYEAISIIEKIRNKDFSSIKSIVSARKPFDLPTDFIKNSQYKQSPDELTNPLLCYGKGHCIGYVERKLIKKNNGWIDKYKVITPYANNIGTELNDDNLNAFISEPNSICTETYLVIGADLNLTKTECQNLIGYLQTKFVRFLISLSKSGHHATAAVYQFVPLLDFSKIWTDEDLYEKYGLDLFEREYIESLIKPMD